MVFLRIGIACTNRILYAQMRSELVKSHDINMVYHRENPAARCQELSLDVLFYECADITRQDIQDWHAIVGTGTDLVLLMRNPTPAAQRKALRAGVCDMITQFEESWFAGHLHTALETISREKAPVHDREVCIRSFGQAVVTIRGIRYVLTRTEYHVLRVLIDQKGKFVDAHTLAERVWGRNAFGRREDLYVYISRLREKLEIDPAQPSLIVSSRGLGYAFWGEVWSERHFA